MLLDPEVRYTKAAVEVRSASDRTIGGYGVVFRRLSADLGGFVEQVEPSFTRKSEGDGWPGVYARFQHDDAFILGSSDSGTLRLNADDTGVRYDVDVPQTRQDVYELVQRGDIRSSSFAFKVAEDEWTVTDQGYPLRTLHSGRMLDVAPVSSPAYADASVGLRSLASHMDADLEEVRSLARQGDLTKLFRRTDRPSVSALRADLMKKKFGPTI